MNDLAIDLNTENSIKFGNGKNLKGHDKTFTVSVCERPYHKIRQGVPNVTQFQIEKIGKVSGLESQFTYFWKPRTHIYLHG